tara:strand:- start:2889 stop:3560 length:672 start_codon:yes stop_codon:yes gene_type:complete
MKVIVTGSEGLIGKSVCNSLERDGHTLLKLDLSLGHDLTDETFVKKYFKNKADALVNLFALNHHIEDGNTDNNLLDISLNSFEQYLSINLVALFSVCRQFALNNSRGSIVNFSSTYGIVSPRLDLYNNEQKHIGYSVSKAGVLMLTKHLATHLGPNIRVNTIVPGGIEYTQNSEFKNKYSSQTPLKRMMNVDEVYGAVEYLISEKSTYVTGTEIKLDGGWTSW